MKILINPAKKSWKKELARHAFKIKALNKAVKPILRKVKRKGDSALIKFALEYDHVELENLIVSTEEIAYAKTQVSPALKDAILVAKQNIERFHAAQASPELIEEVMPGVTCSRRSVPIQNVGLYIQEEQPHYLVLYSCWAFQQFWLGVKK